MGDYTIPAIAESPIMDVFPYFSGEEEDLGKIERFNAIKNSVPEVEEEVNEVIEELVVEETHEATITDEAVESEETPFTEEEETEFVPVAFDEEE